MLALVKHLIIVNLRNPVLPFRTQAAKGQKHIYVICQQRAPTWERGLEKAPSTNIAYTKKVIKIK